MVIEVTPENSQGWLSKAFGNSFSDPNCVWSKNFLDQMQKEDPQLILDLLEK